MKTLVQRFNVDFENRWWNKQLKLIPSFTIFDNEVLT